MFFLIITAFIASSIDLLTKATKWVCSFKSSIFCFFFINLFTSISWSLWCCSVWTSCCTEASWHFIKSRSHFFLTCCRTTFRSCNVGVNVLLHCHFTLNFFFWVQSTADRFIESELWDMSCSCNEFDEFNNEFDEFNVLSLLQQHQLLICIVLCIKLSTMKTERLKLWISLLI